MKIRLLVLLLLLGTGRAWSQVEPSATGGAADDDETMTLPAPVRSQAYPTAVGDEERSNFLSGGLTFGVSHDDNVAPGSGVQPVSDTIYTILPSIAFRRTTGRQDESLQYSAGALIYDPTSQLNVLEQTATLSYRYRLSRRAALSLGDNFAQSSNAFTSASPVSGQAVSGSSGNPYMGVFAPYAATYTNNGNLEVTYQYSKDGLIGGSGTTSLLNYPNPSQAIGLYNYVSEGGSGFFVRRFYGRQFYGGIYTFYRAVTSAGGGIPGEGDSTTRTDTISLFYTFRLSPAFSISFTGGPQHYVGSYGPSANSTAWTPSGSVSIGWHQKRANVAASYFRTVTGGGGLLGTYDATSAAINARWMMTRNWRLGGLGNYFVSNSATAVQYFTIPNGHTVLGTVTLSRLIGEYMSVEGGYSRLHESYDEVPSVANYPNDNRVFVMVNVHFTRPLGR